MGCTSLATGLCVVLTLSIVTRAADVNDRHVRPMDRRVDQLLEDGVRRSPTLRDLVTELDQSDVVVYLKCDRELRTGLDGQLSFLAASGDRRYLMVRLAPARSRLGLIATIGHELQHAVEISHIAAIVDQQSMAQAYARFGFLTGTGLRGVQTYDTQAAIATGPRVLSEMNGMAADD